MYYRTTGNFQYEDYANVSLIETDEEDRETTEYDVNTETSQSNGSSSSRLSSSDFNQTSASCSSSSRAKQPSKTKSNALDLANQEMAELIKIAKSAFLETPKSTVRLYFDYVAQQVDNENISTAKFRKLQEEINKIVNDIIYEN